MQSCAEECHAKHDNPRSKYAKAYLNFVRADYHFVGPSLLHTMSKTMLPQWDTIPSSLMEISVEMLSR